MAENQQYGVCSSNWWMSTSSGLPRTLATSGSTGATTTTVNEMAGFSWSPEIQAIGSKSDELAAPVHDFRSISTSSGGFKAPDTLHTPESTHGTPTVSSTQLSGYGFSLPVVAPDAGSHGFVGVGRSETSSHDMQLHAEHDLIGSGRPTFRHEHSIDGDERLQNHWSISEPQSENPTMKQIHQQNHLFGVEDQLLINGGQYSGNGQRIPANILSFYGYPSGTLQGFVDQGSQFLNLQPVNYPVMNQQAPAFSSELSSPFPKFPQILTQASSSSSSSSTNKRQPSERAQFLQSSPASSTAQFLPPIADEKLNNNSKMNSSEMYSSDVKSSSTETTVFKRPRTPTGSPPATFKVRKEKLSDRVTALQQLVSPFGKTDTASVLQEAIQYIKFLHEQVNVLSNPYMKGGVQVHQNPQNADITKDYPKVDLRSRGLCLLPISSTFPVSTEIAAPDWWTSSFGLNYR